jgi:hypothetical protein
MPRCAAGQGSGWSDRPGERAWLVRPPGQLLLEELSQPILLVRTELKANDCRHPDHPEQGVDSRAELLGRASVIRQVCVELIEGTVRPLTDHTGHREVVQLRSQKRGWVVQGDAAARWSLDLHMVGFRPE